MKKIFSLFILAIIFHTLMWEAGIGLNILLFSSLTTGLAFWLKPEICQRPMVRAVLLGWCLSAFLVTLHHSILSMFVFWLFTFVVVGHLQVTKISFWAIGLLESARGILLGWFISLRELGGESTATMKWQPIWRQVRLWFIPLAILVPFYLIYNQANTTLNAVNEQLGTWIQTLFQFDLDWWRIIIFLLGWAFIIALLGKRDGIPLLHEWVKGWQFSLVRKRPSYSLPGRTLGLKHEYQTAVYTFVVLNALLFFVNVLDLIWVWFSPQTRTAAELSQYVHEGTWLLIFSIILAMLVVLLFLRGNLNFYPRNKQLRELAILWLAQNAFLALSVGVRNGHYIDQYGLAYGRIVVVFFLILVVFGLYTMYQKVIGPRTAFYLLEINGRAILLLLLVAAAFNWDSLITRHNLQRENPDIYHLQYMLDNNLTPLLEAAQNATMLGDRLNHSKLQSRAQKLERKAEKHDWRSWNWSTHRQLKAWKNYQNTQ